MNRGTAPQAILVVRTDRLGETLLNLPVLSTLKGAFPQARVIWLVNEALVELLREAPGVDDVVGYPSQPPGSPWWQAAWRLARRLHRERFDLAVLSNPKKEFHVACWLAGIPQRVGYDRKWGRLLTSRIPDRKALGEQHEIEYNLELLKVLGIEIRAPVLQLPVREDAELSISQLLDFMMVMKTDQLVAIHPWTSNLRKQWPSERFRALVQRLAELSGVRPVVVGSKEDQARCSEVMRGEEGKVLNVVGRLSLRELAAFLRRVRVLVSNDSGPMHLAAAVGTPVVALFGTDEPGSHPTRWGPWGAGHTVIHKPLAEITVEEVLGALQRYL